MYQKIIEVKTKKTSAGVEPDVEIDKGMDLCVIDYSPDLSTCKCRVVRSDANDFSKLQGKDLQEIADPDPKVAIIRKVGADKKILDSSNPAEIGSSV